MSEVLKLILTGMGTVFFILIMVVVLGKIIIRITNMLAPALQVQVASNQSSSEIEPAKLAAIVSAVETVTRGKGKVTFIEKLSE
ncbi:OadG family protein [Maribellus sediminis]|uniref:OadG family protein n=1 Tax=Maribellus sediminis TaxID=2696285 RepID=UPI0014310DCE|nr:OadG family protein [Maribellus sediminis]